MSGTQTLALGQPAEDVKSETADDLVLWSVTTIIGVLDKPALMYWAAEQAASAAIDNEATWKGMLEDRGREEAVKWLRDARFRRPKDRLSNADLGTVFHEAAQTYALTGQRPTREEVAHLVAAKGGNKFAGTWDEADVVVTFLDRFDEWLQRFSPSYQATEVTVYSPTYGYAGTCDGFLTIDGTRFIMDYKTTREALDSRGNPRTPYPEQVALQLAFYRWAEFAAVWRPRRTEKYRRRYYLLSPLEREMAQPVPEVDSGLVIHVTPEACEAFPMRCDRDVHRAALHTEESFRWVQETSKSVMGPPLEVPA